MRRMMLCGKFGLPEGYTRCEYLEGIGNESTYMLIPKIDITNSPYVMFEVAYPNYTSDTNVFGSTIGNIRFEHGIGWQGAHFAYNFGNGFCSNYADIIENGEIKNTGAKTLANQRLVFEYENYNFYLNGIKQPIGFMYVDGVLGIAKNVFLFGTNRDTYKRYSSTRIYSFYVKNQINLIPALDPLGIPCMYDTVTKQSFYNQGTGEFLYHIYDYNENDGVDKGINLFDKESKDIIFNSRLSLTGGIYNADKQGKISFISHYIKIDNRKYYMLKRKLIDTNDSVYNRWCYYDATMLFLSARD